MLLGIPMPACWPQELTLWAQSVTWQWHCLLRGPASVGLGLPSVSLRVCLPGQTETLPPTQPFFRVVKPSKSSQSGWGTQTLWLVLLTSGTQRLHNVNAKAPVMWGPSRCLAFYFLISTPCQLAGEASSWPLTVEKSNFQFPPGGQLPAVARASSAMTSVDQAL